MIKSMKSAGYGPFRAVGTYRSRPLHQDALLPVLRRIAMATAPLWMCGCSDSPGGSQQGSPREVVTTTAQGLPPIQAGAPAGATTGAGGSPVSNGGRANPMVIRMTATRRRTDET